MFSADRSKSGLSSIPMRQIVCLSDRAWTDIPSRTQQLLSRVKNSNILFFNPPCPPFSGIWRERGKLEREDITLYTLPPVPAKNATALLRTRSADLRTHRFLIQKIRENHFHSPLLWLTSPAYVSVLDAIDHKGLVYDCADAFTDTPATWESELAAAADVVFAASPYLVHHLEPCNPNVVLLPDGCNYAMFSRTPAADNTVLQGRTAPRIGYVGSLSSNVDLSPMLALARRLPSCDIFLIGSDKGAALLPELLREKNVFYFENISTIDLPDYVQSFRVCVSLRRENNLVKDKIPSQMFEYLSTGIPVVSLASPGQIEYLPDCVYTAHSVEEFISLCRKALTEQDSWARERRRSYGKAASWSHRADTVINILDSIGL